MAFDQTTLIHVHLCCSCMVLLILVADPGGLTLKNVFFLLVSLKIPTDLPFRAP